jgi:hypothetical protein
MNKVRFHITIVVVALMLAVVGCNVGAPAPTATPVPPTNTSVPLTDTLVPTATTVPTNTPKPTATPNIVATQQFEAIFSLVQTAYDKGQIASTKGQFIPLADFEKEWAQIGYYDYFDTGQLVTDFIVSAHIKWQSAIDNAELSGCGFVFRLEDDNDHYLIYLDRGRIRVSVSNASGGWTLGIGTSAGNGRLDFGNPAETDFAMVANGGKVYVYIGGEYRAEFTVFSDRFTYPTGKLAYAIKSGTNKDYGTRCNMTQVGLWKIKH